MFLFVDYNHRINEELYMCLLRMGLHLVNQYFVQYLVFLKNKNSYI